MKKVVKTNKAPEAIGPYSQAVIHNGIVYCSGQIALSPESMEVVNGGVREQAERVMKNLKEVLVASNSDLNMVIKCSIFLKSMEDFKDVNDVYGSFFSENPPARETVAVKTLPKDVLVEISCIAAVYGE